uniref:RNA helicase n=1 Tax=Panagrellus redivivus TaxID=6233 RepID=A0A7E4USE4_PANRE
MYYTPHNGGHILNKKSQHYLANIDLNQQEWRFKTMFVIELFDRCKENKVEVLNVNALKELAQPEIWKTLNSTVTNAKTAAEKFMLFVQINFVADSLAHQNPISLKARLSARQMKRWSTSVQVYEIKFSDDDKTQGLRRGMILAFRVLGDNAMPKKLFEITRVDGLTCCLRMGWSDYDKYKDKDLVVWINVNYKLYEVQYVCIKDIVYKKQIHNKLCFEDSPKIKAGYSTDYVTRELMHHDQYYNNRNDNSETDDDDDFQEITAPKQRQPAFYNKVEYNAVQKKAVDELTKDTDSTFVLFGPPGTGKTVTLVEAIVRIVRNGGRVLVCAPSNKAADVIAEMLIKRGQYEPKQLLRLISQNRDYNDISLSIRKHCGVEIMPTPEEPIQYFVVKSLNYYDIVVSTLGTAPNFRKFNQRRFSHIVVDEAGQAPEMEIWTTLSTYADNKARLILAGDPQQLGPYAIQLLEKPEYGYKDSMLTRLMARQDFQKDQTKMIQLHHSYRAHRHILSCYSRLFYNNSLIPTKNKDHSSLENWKGLRVPSFPFLFIDVDGECQQHGDESFSNAAEMLVILQVTNSIRQHLRNDDEIGIVSPYRHQSALIQSHLKDSNITVASVEKFQGSERRVILITAVRNGMRLGFLKDPRRLNTAISRAQHLLIIVGHAESLENIPHWEQIIRYCKDNNSFVQYGLDDWSC